MYIPHPLKLSLTLSQPYTLPPSCPLRHTQDHYLLQNLLPLCWLSTGGRGLDQDTAMEAGQLPSPIIPHPSLLTTHHSPPTHHSSFLTPHLLPSSLIPHTIKFGASRSIGVLSVYGSFNSWGLEFYPFSINFA